MTILTQFALVSHRYSGSRCRLLHRGSEDIPGPKDVESHPCTLPTQAGIVNPDAAIDKLRDPMDRHGNVLVDRRYKCRTPAVFNEIVGVIRTAAKKANSNRSTRYHHVFVASSSVASNSTIRALHIQRNDRAYKFSRFHGNLSNSIPGLNGGREIF